MIVARFLAFYTRIALGALFLDAIFGWWAAWPTTLIVAAPLAAFDVWFTSTSWWRDFCWRVADWEWRL